MRKIQIIIILLLSFIGSRITSNAQNVGINATGIPPDNSAMLDISSPDKGLLIPRMDSTSRKSIVTPATGLMVFDSTCNSFYYHNGMAWVKLIGGLHYEIRDVDNDTKITVEKTADEDSIRFDIMGSERLVLKQNANGKTMISMPNNNNSLYLGENAGLNSNSFSNTFIGAKAGLSTINGNSNTFIGTRAGYFNTSGGSQVLIGTAAGRLNTTGDLNVSIGTAAGQLSNGSFNTFIGNYAGPNTTPITNGNNNTVLGAYAGHQIKGSGNVFLGRLAGYYETGSDKLYIENSALGTPLIYGDFATDTVKIYGTLGVKDEYHFPITDGGSGQFLKTDGSGNLSWQTASSTTVFEDTDNDTKIQVEESTDEDIIRLDVKGSEVLQIKQNAHGSTLMEFPNNNSNTFVGLNAGLANNTTLSDNGYSNSFFGFNAGSSTTTGNANVFIGSNAGSSVVVAENNTFIGTDAGVNNTRSDNVFIGTQTGNNNVNGFGNTFIGSFSGYSSTGDRNIFIGRNAGFSEIGDNKLYIENGSSTAPLIYGDFNKDSLQINGRLTAVSTSARPLLIQHNQAGNGAYLEVNNASGTRALFGVDGNGFSGGDTTDVSIANWSNGDLVLHTNATEQMRITAAGNVGIGRTAATNILEIDGQASKTSAGSWVANSDARLKKNVTSLSSEKMLTNLLALKGVTYVWNDTITGYSRPEGIQFGFTAQNIQEVFPTLVEEDNLGYLQTAYGTYDAMTVEAIRALNDKIDKQAHRIDELRKLYRSLEKKNEALKAQVTRIDQLESMVENLSTKLN